MPLCLYACFCRLLSPNSDCRLELSDWHRENLFKLFFRYSRLDPAPDFSADFGEPRRRLISIM